MDIRHFHQRNAFDRKNRENADNRFGPRIFVWFLSLFLISIFLWGVGFKMLPSEISTPTKSDSWSSDDYLMISNFLVGTGSNWLIFIGLSCPVTKMVKHSPVAESKHKSPQLDNLSLLHVQSMKQTIRVKLFNAIVAITLPIWCSMTVYILDSEPEYKE